MSLFEHCVMMSSSVTAVYVNCWSWHVHGSHSVCLLKSGVTPADCLCVEHRTVRWHTRLSGAHTPDCPVHLGTAAQRLVPGGTRREDHQTVWCDDQTVRCEKPTAPTVTCSDRATARRTRQGTVRCLVCPQKAATFLQRLHLYWGHIYTPN
jgi:hypothetical protein